MKFGETLYQRSVPEWSAHNVEYNDLKHLIKVRTTKGSGQAQTIPGSSNEAWALRKFEDELYTELADQHARVNLFVRSKSGEISRRLAHLHDQITTLTRRSLSRGLSKITVRQLERFSNLEDQTLRAGEDILKLKQFVNANHEGLKKLLKKYKKWTGSSGLISRFHRGVLDHPSSFSSSSFEPLLTQHIDTLAAVRQPFNAGSNWSADLSPKLNRSRSSSYNPTTPSTSPLHGDRLLRAKHPSTAAYLDFVNLKGSRLEMDAALATAPLNEDSCRAIFWIHPENILEAQILLLRHAALRNWTKSADPDQNASSSRTSRRSSVSGNKSDSVNTGGVGVTLIVCDDLDQFSKRQNAKTFDDAEASKTAAPERAAACLRSMQSRDLLLTVNTVVEDVQISPRKAAKGHFRFAKFDRKCVRRLFDSSSEDEHPSNDPTEEACEARTWLENHQEIHPLVQIVSKRSQFVGLRNNEKAGLWMTLDTEICMAECSKETINFKDHGSLTTKGKIRDQWQQFPYGILEIRTEGGVHEGLIDALDDSHLATRVPGFSLEVHAVSAMCKESTLRPPHWLPLSKSDIRQLPCPIKSPTRQPVKTHGMHTSTVQTSSTAPSTRQGQSSSGPSILLGESSATSVPEDVQADPKPSPDKKKRKPKRRVLPAKDLGQHPAESGTRYWNEFDDGSEGEGDEPFQVLVDPNAPDFFSRLLQVSDIWESLKDQVQSSSRKARNWFTSSPAKQAELPSERQRLFDHFPSPDLEDSSGSESDTQTGRGRHYSTMSSQREAKKRARHETNLFRGCVGWFAASYILIILSLILIIVGRRNPATVNDIGVIICVAASLVFGILGVGFMIARHDDLGWVHRATVALMLLIVALANAALLYGLDHWVI